MLQSRCRVDSPYNTTHWIKTSEQHSGPTPPQSSAPLSNQHELRSSPTILPRPTLLTPATSSSESDMDRATSRPTLLKLEDKWEERSRRGTRPLTWATSVIFSILFEAEDSSTIPCSSWKFLEVPEHQSDINQLRSFMRNFPGQSSTGQRRKPEGCPDHNQRVVLST